MIRVLIVDDEILVRVGLKTVIPWEQNGFELVGEAIHGEDALRILEATPCHIVLTDIRMPVMDGLELMMQIRERWPTTKCLILSSHNDFEYVQKALRLGAIDYILKLAMNPDELLLKLNGLKEEINEELQHNDEVSHLEFKIDRYGREVKEKRLLDLLLKQCSGREIHNVFEEFNIPDFKQPIHVINVKMDHYDSVVKEEKFQSEQLLSYAVANILAEIIKKYGNGELIEIEYGKFTIIKDEFEQAMLEEIKDASSTFFKISLSFGVSKPFPQILDVSSAYNEAVQAMEHRFYFTQSQIIHYEQLAYAEDKTMPESWTEQQWMKWMDSGDRAAIQEALLEWYDSHCEGRKIKPDSIRQQLIRLLDFLARYVENEGGDIYSIVPYEGEYPYHIVRRSEALSDIYEWLTGWLHIYLDYVKQLSKKKWKPEIQTVVNRIHEHYNLPLKVSDLAKEVGFAENYLSVLFKKETGETFMDYIIKIRMKKARELLKDPAYKIYEISEMVGYGDPTHFSKLFKKIEGFHPTDFRKLYLGK